MQIHRGFPGLLLILLLGTFLPAGLHEVRGQQPDTLRVDTAGTPVYEVQGLTIVVPRPVSTTGGASAVEVNLDSLMVAPAPTLAQVLREMPLIQIRRNSRGEAQPALRGGEDRQIAVLVDGVPLTLGWDARTDLSIIPLTAAQNLNLIRGLSSVLHGPNVLGGVVEIDVARGSERQRPPRPLQLDLGMDHTGARTLGISGGTFLESGDGSWILRGGVGHQARNGFLLPDGDWDQEGLEPGLLRDGQDADLRLNTDMERFDGFVSARYLADSGRWLSFSAMGFEGERGVAPEAHVDDPRLWRYPSQNRFVTAVTAGTGQRATAWGEGDLEMTLGADLGSTEIDQYATPSYQEVIGGESADDRTYTLRLMGDHSLGSRAEIRGALTYADVSHDEVLGGEEKNQYRQRLWSLGTEAEWVFEGRGGREGPGGSRFSLGLALDGADTPETAGKPDLGRLWDWGGRVGATTLLMGDRLLLHGAASRRTRFPALRELYSGALGRFVPNPELRPEVLTGGEVGFTFRRPETEIQAVGFHQRLTDGIVRSSVATPEGKKYKRINEDEIRSSGLELLASSSLGPVAVSGDLTLQRVRGIAPDGEEKKLEYEPEIMGRFSASLPLWTGFRGTATTRFVGRQYCENPELGGLEPFDGSGHLDLRLHRVFDLIMGPFRRVDGEVRLDNATDAVVMDQCGLPQPGRTLRIQLRVW